MRPEEYFRSYAMPDKTVDIDTVQLATSDTDIRACCDCMRQLRPHVDEDTFVDRVRSMESEGYRLASITDDGKVVAVAGFRHMNTLFGGHTIYVDDLVTSADARSCGFGATLIAWLKQRAVETGCKMLHLDSGTQRHRAHRFYLANDMHINCFHFAYLPDDQH